MGWSCCLSALVCPVLMHKCLCMASQQSKENTRPCTTANSLPDTQSQVIKVCLLELLRINKRFDTCSYWRSSASTLQSVQCFLKRGTAEVNWHGSRQTPVLIRLGAFYLCCLSWTQKRKQKLDFYSKSSVGQNNGAPVLHGVHQIKTCVK